MQANAPLNYNHLSYKTPPLSTPDFLMRSCLDLLYVPESLEEDKKKINLLYKKKINFISYCIKKETPQVAIIFSQNKRIPLLHAAMQYLKQNYEKWDSLKEKKDILALKDKLHNQHNNITHLSKILNSLKNVELLPELPKDTLIKYDSFLKGENQLKENILRSLKSDLKNIIEQLRKSEEISPDFKTKKFPISRIAMQKVSAVFEAERLAKVWTARQPILLDQSGSQNFLVKLRSPFQEDLIQAFYKESKNKPIEVMEKLVWDIACIFGQEKQFVATKESKILTKRELTSGLQKMTFLQLVGTVNDHTFHLETLKFAKKPFKGSLQVAIKGRSLAEYLKETTPVAKISRSQLIKASLAIQVFGMYDVHEENIIIDDRGHCHFFDNTRSLCHSNGVILWGDELIPSYRSSLFMLKNTYKKLSLKEKSLIRQEIQKYKNKVADVENFLNLPITKAQIKKLPVDWFNSVYVVKAMKERIAALEKAAEDSSIDNLRDLAFAAHPAFKFFAALTIVFINFDELNKNLDHYKVKKLQLDSLDKMGAESIDNLLSTTVKKGLDPLEIKNLCESSISFDDVIIALGELCNTARKQMAFHYPETQNETLTRIKAYLKTKLENGNNLLKNFYDEAKNDFKDICINYSLVYYLNSEIHKAGIDSTNPDNLESDLNKIDDFIPLISINEDNYPPVVELHFKDSRGQKYNWPLDYLTFPKKIIIGTSGSPMTISHIKSYLFNFKSGYK